MATEHPILFNGEMVRAILAGRKTVTRRPVKPQPLAREADSWSKAGFDWPCAAAKSMIDTDDPIIGHLSPYGPPGDRLWVRETHAIENCLDTGWRDPPHDDGRPLQIHEGIESIGEGRWWMQPHYRATDPEPALDYPDIEGPACRWRPSIFMKRWASRITLEVVDVRVERLHAMSIADLHSEGMPAQDIIARAQGLEEISPDILYAMRYGWFQNGWDGMYAKRKPEFSWDKNPWVWRVEFSVSKPALEPVA